MYIKKHKQMYVKTEIVLARNLIINAIQVCYHISFSYFLNVKITC